MESAGPGVITIQGCDWGGGGTGPEGPGSGGGTGDGGDGSTDAFDEMTDEEWEAVCPIADPDCEDRYIKDWSPGEILSVDAAVNVIRDRGCPEHANYLEAERTRIGIWEKRILSDVGTPITGQVHPVTGRIAFWSGYNKQPGDNVNWTRTLAHEATHVLFKTMPESDVKAVAGYCSGDYL